MITDKELLQELADYLEDRLEEAPASDQKWFMDAIAVVARVVDRRGLCLSLDGIRPEQKIEYRHEPSISS